MTRWMKGPPRAEGQYWYWVLGSGMVRSQEVFLFDGDLCITTGDAPPFSVKQPWRLWARSIRRPPMPSADEMAALDTRRKVSMHGTGSQ